MMKPFVGWFEIAGKDRPALQRFYAQLFDWSINDEADRSGYGLVEAGEKGIAGGIGASEGRAHDGVTPYVEADDPAAFFERAEKPGGKTAALPAEIPDFGLNLAFFADPERHVVGLFRKAVQ